MRCGPTTRLQNTDQLAPWPPSRQPGRGPDKPTGRSSSEGPFTQTQQRVHIRPPGRVCRGRTESCCATRCVCTQVRTNVALSHLQRPQPCRPVLAGGNHKSSIPAKAAPVHGACVAAQYSRLGLVGTVVGKSCVVPNTNGAVVKTSLSPKRPTRTCQNKPQLLVKHGTEELRAGCSGPCSIYQLHVCTAVPATPQQEPDPAAFQLTTAARPCCSSANVLSALWVLRKV